MSGLTKFTEEKIFINQTASLPATRAKKMKQMKTTYKLTPETKGTILAVFVLTLGISIYLLSLSNLQLTFLNY